MAIRQKKKTGQGKLAQRTQYIKYSSSNLMPGLAARAACLFILMNIYKADGSWDKALARLHAHAEWGAMERQDMALTISLARACLRRRGHIDLILRSYLTAPLSGLPLTIREILRIGVTQILFTGISDHAAVDLSVELAKMRKNTARFKGVVNAVLRSVTREREACLARIEEPAHNLPAWLYERWKQQYGAAQVQDIASMQLEEPNLDLTFKQYCPDLAQTLGGARISNLGQRLDFPTGEIEKLAGFAQGQWWVQGAAAMLPAQLFGDLTGRTAIDLCAAPGGKSLQMAMQGAGLTCLDRSAQRLQRLAENFKRVGLSAKFHAGDMLSLESADLYDAVLLDAPCTASGMARRHPEIPWFRSQDDIATLAERQKQMLNHAAMLLRPGGVLIYSTCSLEAEEGEQQITALLDHNDHLRRVPVSAAELNALSSCADTPALKEEILTLDGDIRCLPCHFSSANKRSGGLEGFFCSRLERLS